jgi:hypothetical protein
MKKITNNAWFHMEAITYLNSCNEWDFDDLQHLITNLQTKYQFPEQEIIITIACSDFWPMLIEMEPSQKFRVP